MRKIVRITSPEGLAEFTAPDALPMISSDALSGHRPDAHWLLVENGKRPVARCSLWWRTVPDHPGQRLGLIGHYASRDRAAGIELLGHACAELAGRGCTLAVGPLDGATWRRYRFVVERGGEPPFFLEPDNPDEWPLLFTAAGFREFASYHSSLDADLSTVDPRLSGVGERMARRGVTLRELDPARFEQELDAIFELCLIGFRRNFLYTPIGREEFKGAYRKVRPFIRPELTLLAEHEGRTVGFLFALPDMLQAQRGNRVDTVIMKSIAVLPGKSYGGLGNLLMGRTLANIRDLGYRRAIHALVYDGNSSRHMSARYARPMRRYALFSRRLP